MRRIPCRDRAKCRMICEGIAENSMHALDDTDRALLRLLRADGRMSNAALAAEVGLSPSACLRRLRLLEHRGVIRGYAALIAEAPVREGVTSSSRSPWNGKPTTA